MLSFFFFIFHNVVKVPSFFRIGWSSQHSTCFYWLDPSFSFYICDKHKTLVEDGQLWTTNKKQLTTSSQAWIFGKSKLKRKLNVHLLDLNWRFWCCWRLEDPIILRSMSFSAFFCWELVHLRIWSNTWANKVRAIDQGENLLEYMMYGGAQVNPLAHIGTLVAEEFFESTTRDEITMKIRWPRCFGIIHFEIIDSCKLLRFFYGRIFYMGLHAKWFWFLLRLHLVTKC